MKNYNIQRLKAQLEMEDTEYMRNIEIDPPTTENINSETTSAAPTCWGTLQDEEFVPAFKSVDKVPAGIYEIIWNRQLSQNTLKKQPFKTDELYQLPSYEIQDILKDIQNFWDRRDKYKQYNLIKSVPYKLSLNELSGTLFIC